MIRNGGQSNSIDESKKSINNDSHTKFNTSSMKKRKKTGNKNSHHHQTNNKNDAKLSNSNNPKSMNNKPSDGQSAISANDFIDFIRNNWKLNQATNSQNINNNSNDHQNVSGIGPSTSDNQSDRNNIFKDFNINQLIAKSPSLPSDIGHHHSIDIGNGDDGSRPNFSSNIISKLKNSKSPLSSSATKNDSKKKFQIFKKKAKIEDFKMSHLTFIDTEVPNYGNQLLIKDPDKDVDDDSSHHFSSSMTMRNHHLKSKPLSSSNDHDLERANRWNNVLSSI
ncbi:hypothetical protein BLA29_003062 [Euroglyphus maynei]|uniref:Uncharacterized protein n=1 Tax=Euroglyphus maynei TaxID=6958 RepID=A0A1Y3B5V2_EURMA|nr:hypothetical protein BLA29_003062 [Euroglyphus maynei]